MKCKCYPSNETCPSEAKCPRPGLVVIPVWIIVLAICVVMVFASVLASVRSGGCHLSPQTYVNDIPQKRVCR